MKYPALLLLSLAVLPALGQTPKFQTIPAPGIEVPEDERKSLTAAANELRRDIDDLRKRLTANAQARELLPDVEIFHKAVDWALRHNEFFDKKQFASARKWIEEGRKRAEALRNGQAPWTTATGRVLRGFRSRIDGSVQPYGIVVPAGWDGKAAPKEKPAWIWNHGRNDKLTELAFLDERTRKPDDFTPEGTFVVHPYGRFCNATKFAGEVDVFEALAHAERHYPIHPQRVVVAGFSMGGASTWHLATHYPGRWAAAHAGAGFAETAEYARVFGPGKQPPPQWEQVLWRWYDATVYARNLANLPVVAYSGEKDKQKQAADIMLRFAEKEGLTFEHVIGPNMEHKYDAESKKRITALITSNLLANPQPAPETIRFVTYTLRYPECDWLRVEGLEKHWERAEVTARQGPQTVQIQTTNVTSLRVALPGLQTVKIDDAQITLAAPSKADGVLLSRIDGKWSAAPLAAKIRKRPGLQGPIDDAFMEPFLFVRPTGKPLNDKIGAWVKDELALAERQWRGFFRGDVPIKDDTAVRPEDWRDRNLVLWGDPSSNKVLAQILAKLPLKWTAQSLELGAHKLDAAHHAPILIFPNPLNPERYVVINSGFTFCRAASSGSNSQQTPKLPDWALVDLRTPSDGQNPGLIHDAGFFDESWALPK